MPRRHTSLRRRGSVRTLTWRTLAHLYFGPDSNNCSFSSPEEARPVWEHHQKTLLRWWRSGIPDDFYVNPFGFGNLPEADERLVSRPWAWWKFSAVEPRRLLSVYADGAKHPATDEDRDRARQLGLGLSTSAHEYADGAAYTFEENAAYFARHDLPTANETEEPAP